MSLVGGPLTVIGYREHSASGEAGWRARRYVMGSLSWWHWLIIIAALVLIFGAKKLPDAARGIGRSMRILKSEVSAMHDDDVARSDQTDQSPSAPAATVPPVTPAIAPAPATTPIITNPPAAAVPVTAPATPAASTPTPPPASVQATTIDGKPAVIINGVPTLIDNQAT
jgi:sec-independent protein translocase protein TatA